MRVTRCILNYNSLNVVLNKVYTFDYLTITEVSMCASKAILLACHGLCMVVA